MSLDPAGQIGGEALVQTLADFRYQLRQFLRFSEETAKRARLAPRQHQLLLQVAGAAAEVSPTIAYVAERLGIRQNSAVELTDRCVEEGLVERTADANDRRKVVLRVTARGRGVLQKLSGAHAQELKELGPRLVTTLKRLSEHEISGVEERVGGREA